MIFLGDPADIGKGPQTVERWFNTSAGFTRASSLRRDSANDVDLSINKRWRLNERGTEVRVRGEALNAFNHPLFAGPRRDRFNTAFGQITATANYPRRSRRCSG